MYIGQSYLAFFFSLSVIKDNVILAHNQEYLDIGNIPVTLSAGDELAVIPPISGG